MLHEWPVRRAANLWPALSILSQDFCQQLNAADKVGQLIKNAAVHVWYICHLHGARLSVMMHPWRSWLARHSYNVHHLWKGGCVMLAMWRSRVRTPADAFFSSCNKVKCSACFTVSHIWGHYIPPGGTSFSCLWWFGFFSPYYIQLRGHAQAIAFFEFGPVKANLQLTLYKAHFTHIRSSLMASIPCMLMHVPMYIQYSTTP